MHFVMDIIIIFIIYLNVPAEVMVPLYQRYLIVWAQLFKTNDVVS